MGYICLLIGTKEEEGHNRKKCYIIIISIHFLSNGSLGIAPTFLKLDSWSPERVLLLVSPPSE